MTRKLKSKEYCHNCGEESEWVFEDRPGNQIIICPLCKHEHYRVVTGELVRPKIEYGGKVIKDVKKFLKEHPELKDTFQKLEEEAKMKFEVSGRRWGQDPSQAGGITYGWTTSGTSTTTSWDYVASSSVITNYDYTAGTTA